MRKYRPFRRELGERVKSTLSGLLILSDRDGKDESVAAAVGLERARRDNSSCAAQPHLDPERRQSKCPIRRHSTLQRLSSLQLDQDPMR